METLKDNIVSTKWVLDPAHSELLFRVKHLMITNVKGEFKNFTAVMDGDDFNNARVRVRVDTGSIYTNNDDRDNHLRSADFFDSENHPAMTFESKTFKKIEDDSYILKGILSIKGISKEVELNVEYGGTVKDPWGQEKAGFSFEGRINRKDWGLNWNAVLESGGVLVSDDVKINGEVQFVKQSLSE